MKELFGEELQIHLKVDSSACHCMILRHGAGRVKHLCTKQLWIQETTKNYNISVDDRAGPQQRGCTHPRGARALDGTSGEFYAL